MQHVPGVDYEAVERNHRRWWDIHAEDKPFHARMGVGQAGTWPPLLPAEGGKLTYESVGGFCHVEFESEQIEMWGFERKADRDRFVSTFGGTAL